MYVVVYVLLRLSGSYVLRIIPYHSHGEIVVGIATPPSPGQQWRRWGDVEATKHW